jgi:hypothetical protein
MSPRPSLSHPVPETLTRECGSHDRWGVAWAMGSVSREGAEGPNHGTPGRHGSAREKQDLAKTPRAPREGNGTSALLAIFASPREFLLACRYGTRDVSRQDANNAKEGWMSSCPLCVLCAFARDSRSVCSHLRNLRIHACPGNPPANLFAIFASLREIFSSCTPICEICVICG